MKEMILTFFLVAQLFSEELPKEITLEESISMALANNFSLISKEREVKSEEHRQWEAFSGFLPRISLKGGRILAEELRPVNVPFAGEIKIDFTYDYTLQLQGIQPLFTWGRIFYGFKGARENLLGKKEEYRGKREDIIAETIKAYYSVLLAREMVTLTKEALRTAEEHLKVVEARFRAGEAIDLEVMRAKVEVANAKTQVIEAEDAYQVALLYFRKVIGAEKENLIPSGSIEDLIISFPEQELREYVEIALSNRPELGALRHYEKALEMASNSQRGAFLPAFALSGQYQAETNDLSGKWVRSGSLVLGFEWSIFDGGLTYHTYKSLKASKESLFFTRKEVEDLVKLEVKKSYMDLLSAMEMVNAGKETLNTAKRGLDIAEERYKAGLMTNLEVMDAQLAFKGARINYIKSLYRYLLAKVSLYRAIGMTENLVKGGKP